MFFLKKSTYSKLKKETIYKARDRELKSQNRAIQITKYQARWSHKNQILEHKTSIQRIQVKIMHGKKYNTKYINISCLFFFKWF